MVMKTAFVCSACGYESSKWYGKCPECGLWNTFSEIKIEGSKTRATKGELLGDNARPIKFSKIETRAAARVSSGSPEFDRVLGGGIVPGSVILIAGDPGVGKSTLLLQLAISLAPPQNVLYITGEESESQLKIRAERILGSESKKNDFFVLSTGSLEAAGKACEELRPSLVIVDSIQTIASSALPGLSGSIPQIRYATSKFVTFAKKNRIPVFLVGHVTKEGMVAGPMILSHMVDAVLYLEGEAEASPTRFLRSFKNRFADTSEVGIFEMGERGLSEVLDPGKFFIEKNGKRVAGRCLSVVMEGSRPIVIEIQALVSPTTLAYPRRVSNGIQDKRLELLIAIIQKHLKIPLERMDVFVNVVGGLLVRETASDLAVCTALVSSFKNKPILPTCAIAEVGLLSEIKHVSSLERRVKEARKLGIKNILTAQTYTLLGQALLKI